MENQNLNLSIDLSVDEIHDVNLSFGDCSNYLDCFSDSKLNKYFNELNSVTDLTLSSANQPDQNFSSTFLKSSDQLKFKCNIGKCSKEYINKQHLTRHLLNSHAIDKRSLNSICEKCNSKFSKRKDLIEHLNTVHDANIEIRNQTLNSKEEFDKFKLKIEDEHHLRYVKLKGTSNNITKFDCSRSGKKRLVDLEKRKNDINEKGSSKIGLCCTAYMKLTKKNGKFLFAINFV